MHCVREGPPSRAVKTGAFNMHGPVQRARISHKLKQLQDAWHRA